MISIAPLAGDSPTYRAPAEAYSHSALHHDRVDAPQEHLQDFSQYTDPWSDLYSENFFDPLGAIDFSNFAPGTTDPSRIPEFL
jgi:hypothetical protein